MISNPIVFYIASAIIIIFTFLSLLSKNVIYSLLLAILVFFFGAVIFYILGSEYNAIIQAAIYGLAVPIIIGISIMFCSDKDKNERHVITPSITLLCSGIFILAFVYLAMISLAINPDTFEISEPTQYSAFSTIYTFAKGIFINYVWAFELVSILLTVVIAGIGLLGNKKGALWK